jgi:hypothetical protein
MAPTASLTHAPAADTGPDLEANGVQLLLAEDRIAVLEAAVRLQRDYVADLQEEQAWTAVERDTARKQLAEAVDGFAVDVAELHAENLDLAARLVQAEAARDIAISDLRSVLDVVELGIAQTAAAA